jgi:hypothetical protein
LPLIRTEITALHQLQHAGQTMQGRSEFVAEYCQCVPGPAVRARCGSQSNTEIS